MENTDTQKPTGLLDKLRAHKAARGGTDTFTLPETKVTVTIPQFRSYEAWQRAQRLAGRDADRSQLLFLLEICTFDGERLRANDYAELIPSGDHLFLLGKVYGGDSPEGNEAKAPADA